MALERRYRVPAIGRFREFADDGGLISYGPDLTDINRQLGVYAAKILSGARPADLPVQQPTKFELVINMKTAKELGLTVRPGMLDQLVQLFHAQFQAWDRGFHPIATSCKRRRKSGHKGYPSTCLMGRLGPR